MNQPVNISVELLKSLIKHYYAFRRKAYMGKLYQQVCSFLQHPGTLHLDRELFDGLENIRKNGVTLFPYDFAQKYDGLPVNVSVEQRMPCIRTKAGKLYFKDGWTEQQAQSFFRQILREQDPDSPHCYTDAGFKVEKDDWLIDIGVAEGYFSLGSANIAEKILLFEKQRDWQGPLQKTFEPFFEKTRLVNKVVSDRNNRFEISLDSISELFSKPLFIKVDVDGHELKVLKGMTHLLRDNPNIKLSICTYHRQTDAKSIDFLLKDLGYNTRFSSNYMLFYYDKYIQPPFLRRGVLRASRMSYEDFPLNSKTLTDPH